MLNERFKISKLTTHVTLNDAQFDAEHAPFETLPAGVHTVEPRYFIDNQEVLIGQRIGMRHVEYRCCECDRVVKKLFSGTCYPCLQSKASADLCVTNPHRCHYLAGTCREPDWGVSFCYQPHYLYIAFTDKFKIGITRQSQLPYRWIDQGATAATLVAKVGSRHQAGVLETALAGLLADKTHWQRMLKNLNTTPVYAEFSALKKQVIDFLRQQQAALTMSIPEGLQIEPFHTFYDHDTFFQVSYPAHTLPEKIVSLSTDKEPIEGLVTGIKGQYLILDTGVFNMRRHEGTVVSLSLMDAANRSTLFRDDAVPQSLVNTVNGTF